jgi:signal transduction histidine kinase
MHSILVVDDVPTNITLAVDTLKHDYKVMVAIRGQHAIDIAVSDHAPDLILLDIMMPEIDGLEVCRRLKSDERSRDIPIIFLTAMGENDDIVRGLELGAVDYVTKPVNHEVLKARVKTHLQLRDVQKQLEQEMQLVQENADLRADVERITRHDLKNPLSVILGYASMMADDENLGESYRESARFMEESAFTAMDMVNNSLNLYKIEQGSFKLEAMPLDFALVIAKVVASVKTLASQLGVRLEWSPPDREIRFLGDEMLCHSLLSNLLRNAVEAAPEGSTVTIEINAGDDAVVTIHNQGEIPEDIRDRFFEKYATSGKKQGTGLGTYSARLMAEVQNGRIEFDSSAEAGTTLKVSLPLS